VFCGIGEARPQVTSILPLEIVHLLLDVHNPTATLLEHALLTQGFMSVSKVAFPWRLRPQTHDFTCTNLVEALKWVLTR